MESVTKLHCRQQPFHLSINPSRPSFAKPISSLSFTTPSFPSPPLKFSPIRASSSPNPPNRIGKIVKTTSIALTAAAAFFFMQHQLNKPAFSSPVTTPTSSTAESASESTQDVSVEEEERAIEEHLAQNPKDVEALRALMEVKIRSRKMMEAVEVVDRLIELEPNEDEWPLLKSQIYIHSGDFESARKGFEEILDKDPLRVEAYHGLVMAHSESGESLDGVLKRIQAAMDKCKKEKKTSDLRDFKLLMAQISVTMDNFEDALKIYDEMANEEPRDFRPYLCQGILYSLLRRKDEAEKKFEMFKKIVPKNHPYREYLDDKMFSTQFFAERVERERSGMRS